MKTTARNGMKAAANTRQSDVALAAYERTGKRPSKYQLEGMKNRLAGIEATAKKQRLHILDENKLIRLRRLFAELEAAK